MCTASKIITAPPPLEAIVLVCTVLAVCVSSIPRIFSDIDTVATVEVISTPLFEDIISKRSLGLIRLSTAFIFFLTTFYRLTTKGHVVRTPYVEKSKLRTIPFSLDGIRSQVMFTSWCWNLLTISFALNGTITLLSASDNAEESFLYSILHQKWLLRSAIFLFEISAPTSMLVSTVVRYALWPQSLKKGVNGSSGFRRPVALLQHNANIMLTLLEVGVLGRIPVRLGDILLAPMYGVVYIFFTWFMIPRWLESKEPQFVYFFFDTTLGPKVVCSVMLALMATQMLFYVIFTFVDEMLVYLHGGLITNSITVTLIASIFCRFRD